MADHDQTTEKEFMRIEEAAVLFGVSRATLYAWIKRFNIPIYNQGIDPRIKYVKPAEVRAARAKMAQFRPVDGSQGEDQA